MVLSVDFMVAALKRVKGFTTLEFFGIGCYELMVVILNFCAMEDGIEFIVSILVALNSSKLTLQHSFFGPLV